MSVADRLGSAVPSRQGLPCRIAVILSELPVSDRRVLLDVLAVPKGDRSRLSNSTIAAALTEEGFPVHTKSVENHRKGACRCAVSG